MTEILLCLILTQSDPATGATSDTPAQKLAHLNDLENQAAQMRAVIAGIREKLKQARGVDESRTILEKMPDLTPVIRDVPSRARIIEDFQPPETPPSGLALDRLLADFASEEAELASLRDRLARGEILGTAAIQRALRQAVDVSPASPGAGTPTPPSPGATASQAPSGADRPHGSPVLQAILELEEHRVVPLRVLWDRRRAEILAAAPSTEAPQGSGEHPAPIATDGSRSASSGSKPDTAQPIQVAATSLDPIKAAESLYRLSRYRDALQALENLAEIPAGKEAYILYTRAACHRELHEYGKALELLGEAATRYPQDDWGQRAQRSAPLVRVRKELQQLKQTRALSTPGGGGS